MTKTQTFKPVPVNYKFIKTRFENELIYMYFTILNNRIGIAYLR